ncbi:hypothetical protein ZWY2020_039598 [Hordeum vulgare]|nr:hypothetical protein ZWY2020_039598 [Hordeum vulgare]
MAQKPRCNRLVINSDNMKVIDTMLNGGHLARTTAAIFENCYYMACDFSLNRFEHCNRETNKVAREFSRLAKCSMTRDWIEEPTENIVSILTYNVTIISN